MEGGAVLVVPRSYGARVAAYPLTLLIQHQPRTILVDANNEQEARARVTAAWATGNRVPYKKPDGKVLHIVWRNVAIVEFVGKLGR